MAAALSYAENIIETVREPLVVLDASLRVVSVNRSFYRTFQVTPEETQGRLIYDLGNRQWDIPRLRELLEGILRQATEFNDFEVTQAFEHLGTRTMLLNARRISREGNLHELILLAIEDITERERDHEALREAHELLAKHARQLDAIVQQRTARLQETVGDLEAFSYSVAHDLRAPLRAMQGYAEELLKEPGLSAQGLIFLQRIVRAAARLDRLTREVLAYSQLARGGVKLERVDVDKLALAIVEQYPGICGHKINIDIASPLMPVLAQESLLTQVLSNLLVNACKFVAPGVSPRIVVRTEALGEFVRLWVEDNGIGIDAEHHDRLFKIFGRIHPDQKYEGTGIGLAIVKKAVERMDGTVGFVSEPGKGTRFWAELKMA